MSYQSYVRAACLVLAMSSFPAKAHEFWIEPLDFTVASGETIEAHNRIGQMLKGNVDPYIRSTFVRFSLSDLDGTRDVDGNLGDRPALKMQPEHDGLHIASYQSTHSTVRYRKLEKFEKFLSQEGLDWVLGAHKERGLSETKFRESYTRFAKSLVAVGGGEGTDRALGLRIELIALTNPYTDDGPLKVQLLFEGDPAPDMQVAIFRRDSNSEITRETMRTDEKGEALIPRQGAELTLLSAVHMVEPSADLVERKGVVWHSLWASLTYGASL